jgi:hypothetical protein
VDNNIKIDFVEILLIETHLNSCSDCSKFLDPCSICNKEIVQTIGNTIFSGD